jgi:hypothetical protein
MKTFKQLREDVDAKAKNPEAKSLEPRSEGEQQFKDMHTVKTTDYPVSGKGGNTSQTAHQPSNGDRNPIQQGTSKLADKSGFKGNKTPLTRADKTQGDMKPVLTSPSSVGGKWSGYATESVFVNTPVISESDEDVITIELMNGDEIEINSDLYDAIHETYSQLNTGNREIFRSAINEGIDSFERILDFVASRYEEE